MTCNVWASYVILSVESTYEHSTKRYVSQVAVRDVHTDTRNPSLLLALATCTSTTIRSCPTCRVESQTMGKSIVAKAAVVYCASAFQPAVIPRTRFSSDQPSLLLAPFTKSSSSTARANSSDDDIGGLNDDRSGPLDAGDGEGPRSLGHNRTFLGVRRESGVLRRMMEAQGDHLSSTLRVGTALSSSATALMPDGGLSPCVIKVLGVGGGGGNAVSFEAS